MNLLMTISELAPKIQSGELSPVDLTREALASIEKRQPALNAFISITEEHALRQARHAETEIAAGQYRGPLHGIPYAAKDLFYTKGITTTVGSKLMADFVPDFDSTVIEKLNEAGAVMVGKAGLHEWAYGITSNNPHFGTIRNPWDTKPHPRRVERRLDIGPGGGHVQFFAGVGYRRLDSHPRIFVRARGAETDVRPREPLRSFPTGPHARPCRTVWAHGSRHCEGIRGNRRLRCARRELCKPAGDGSGTCRGTQPRRKEDRCTAQFLLRQARPPRSRPRFAKP